MAFISPRRARVARRPTKPLRVECPRLLLPSGTCVRTAPGDATLRAILQSGPFSKCLSGGCCARWRLDQNESFCSLLLKPINKTTARRKICPRYLV